jgi:hypothetical protein
VDPKSKRSAKARSRQRRRPNREALGGTKYTVIARAGTFLHIVKGQLLSAMIDDDPESSNNQPRLFGIEIETTTKVSVRNMWIKKLS